LDVVETSTALNIVMELVVGKDLLKFILEKKNDVNEQKVRRIFKQLADAVLYCHKNNIVHRDIKHKNILIDNKENVKLIDFGLSNILSDGMMGSTFCGTPAYTSPEIFLGHRYVGTLVDVWSLGVVLYTMLASKFPFRNVSELVAGRFSDPPKVSKDCCDLLRKMLVVDPLKRFTLSQVLAHSWLSKN